MTALSTVRNCIAHQAGNVQLCSAKKQQRVQDDAAVLGCSVEDGWVTIPDGVCRRVGVKAYNWLAEGLGDLAPLW